MVIVLFLSQSYSSDSSHNFLSFEDRWYNWELESVRNSNSKTFFTDGHKTYCQKGPKEGPKEPSEEEGAEDNKAPYPILASSGMMKVRNYLVLEE